MALTRKFSELRTNLETEPGAEEAARLARARLGAELKAHAATLAQVRRAREMTQVQIARVLRISQPEVSRIEHQADLFLSTLRSYLEAMGGELRLVAHFPNADDVQLSLAELTGIDTEEVEAANSAPLAR